MAARPKGSSADADGDVSLVGRALARLDPWSFWVVPAASEGAVDFSVVGTTGAFAVSTCSLEGFASPRSFRLMVGKRSVPGLWKVRRGARKLRNALLASIVDTQVQPIVCLTRARYGGPATVGRVRIVGLEDLATEIANRRNILEASRARKGAEALMKVAARG